MESEGNRNTILTDIESIYQEFGIDKCNDFLSDISDKYEKIALAKDFFNSIKFSPLYFDKVKIEEELIDLHPFQLIGLIFDDNKYIEGAYVSDFTTGPPDCISIIIDAVPTKVLSYLLQEFKSNFVSKT